MMRMMRRMTTITVSPGSRSGKASFGSAVRKSAHRGVVKRYQLCTRSTNTAMLACALSNVSFVACSLKIRDK